MKSLRPCTWWVLLVICILTTMGRNIMRPKKGKNKSFGGVLQRARRSRAVQEAGMVQSAVTGWGVPLLRKNIILTSNQNLKMWSLNLIFKDKSSNLSLKKLSLPFYGNASSLGRDVSHCIAKCRGLVGNGPGSCKVWQPFEESYNKDCQLRRLREVS